MTYSFDLLSRISVENTPASSSAEKITCDVSQDTHPICAMIHDAMPISSMCRSRNRL